MANHIQTGVHEPISVGYNHGKSHKIFREIHINRRCYKFATAAGKRL